MRPTTFNRFVPQSYDLKSNKTIWKILNRTIYREDDHTWLRIQDPLAELNKINLPATEREVLRKLIQDYGISYLYPEDVFYKTHKISRIDFLAKLEAVASEKERENILLALYDDAG